MNRRNVMKGVVAVPLAAIPITEFAFPADQPSLGFTAEKFIELPLHAGDEIVGLTVHRDVLWAATRFGALYRVVSE